MMREYDPSGDIIHATRFAKARIKRLEEEELEEPLSADERGLLITMVLSAYMAGFDRGFNAGATFEPE